MMPDANRTEQWCRQQAIGDNEAPSDMTTKYLAELDARASQLGQRMAELRDELAAGQREPVSTAAIQRASRSSIRSRTCWSVLKRFRILHLLLKPVGYDVRRLGLTTLACAMCGLSHLIVESDVK